MEDKFFTLFNESSDAIVLMNDAGGVTEVNKALCRYLGYTRQELLTMNIADLIDPTELATDPIAFKQILAGDHIARERKLLKKDGTVVEMEIKASRVSENLMIASGRDITELRRAQKQINHHLGERVKELNCLYQISELANATGETLEEILGKVVHIIPGSYQFPGIAVARIIFKEQVYQSAVVDGSKWVQQAPITINNDIVGMVEVFYTRQMPEQQEGPFLKEERNLINSIAQLLGSAAERKNAALLMKEQSEVFQAMIENTKESIYLISPDYKIMQFNSTALERMRTTSGRDLTIGADFREYLFEDSIDLFIAMFKDSLTGIYRSEEIRAKVLNDQYYWFQSKTSPVYDLQGTLIGIRLLLEAIDDRKKAEAVLRESEEKFRSIVEQSLVGIYIIQHGKLMYVNPGFEKILGYPKSTLMNQMSFDGLVHPEDVDLVSEQYENRITHRQTKQQYIFRALRKDGAVLHLEVFASMISYNDEPAVIGTLVDITGRVEEERKMNQAVLEAQEKERLQIGMELHDNVNQILAGSGLFMELALIKLHDTEAVAEILKNLKKINIEAMDELRRLSHQLAPLIEADTNLGEMIAWLVKSLKIGEHHAVFINVDEFIKPLSKETQLTFYRILQEQLTNILKYAGASEVTINIHQVDAKLHLQVRDNGRGFNVNKKKEGIGLENIRRRAQMLNGKVEIISSPGKGCLINVLVPIA